jgi:uncharacterized protein DUF742
MDEGRPPSRIRPFLPDEPVPIGDVPSAHPADHQPAVSTLRPYLLTGGRVHASQHLQVETQIVTTETGTMVVDKLAYEQRDIVALCTRPLAVAEVAAHLGLHLGVARVLAGDLVELGYLAVQRTQHDVGILERVIRGLEGIR